MPVVEVYRVEVVEASRPPTGGTPGEWHRYVLSSERSRIVGRYCGSLAKARSNAEMLVRTLNERARTGKSPWAARGRPRKGTGQSQPSADEIH